MQYRTMKDSKNWSGYDTFPKFKDEMWNDINFVEFVSAVDEIDVYYDKISELFLLLGDKKKLNEDRFRKFDQSIQYYSDCLKNCLDVIDWISPEAEKFDAMMNYYNDIRFDAMEYMMEKIDKNKFDLSFQLQEMFDQLSSIVMILDSKKNKNYHRKKLDQKLKSIREKLNSDDTKECMTPLKYNQWWNKYKQAVDYVKKLYV